MRSSGVIKFKPEKGSEYMDSNVKSNQAAARLMKVLGLKNSPMAIKLAKSENEIPTEAIRPMRDMGVHYAECQCLALARNTGNTYALTLEDHWCWFPLICYGFVDVCKGNRDYEIVMNNLGIPCREKQEAFFEKFPRLPYKSVYAYVAAPAINAHFEPDLYLVYCDDTQQLREMAGAIKYMTGDALHTTLDYVDSCGWDIVPSYVTREFRVTIPDPGEIERAEIGRNEIILTIPCEKFIELCAVTEDKLKKKEARPGCNCGLVSDFPRPEFIANLYKEWGLQSDGPISWTEEQRGY